MNDDIFITVDFGNSHPNYFIHDGHNISPFLIEEKIKITDTIKSFADKKIFLLYSSVLSQETLDKKFGYFFNHLKDIPRIHILDPKSYFKDGSFFEMPVNYSQTLGTDRLYQSYYLFQNMQAEDWNKILLIDSGSFATFDIIDRQGFAGGYIYPGVQTLTNLYASQGDSLPLLKSLSLDGQKLKELPHNTESSINNSIVSIYKGIIKELSNNFDSEKQHIIITGGQASFFERLFAIYPFLRREAPFTHVSSLLHQALLLIGLKMTDPQ